jgi:L-ascorbate 6-phosphate lactonase
MTIRTGEALAQQIGQLHVPQGMIAIWGLGQAGVVIKGGDTVAVIDPYLSDSIGGSGDMARRFPPPIAPELLSRVDVVLCSHEHADHTDPATLGPLMAASDASLAITEQSRSLAEQADIDPSRIVIPKLGERQTVKGFSYTAVPAAHEEVEINRAHSRWMGFLIECNSVTLLHAGDTIPCRELYDAIDGVAIDLALLPINGRDYYRHQRDLVGNFLPREATEFAHSIGAQVLIPIHNDLFEANRLNIAELWDDLDRRFPHQRCHPLKPGELYLYVS